MHLLATLLLVLRVRGTPFRLTIMYEKEGLNDNSSYSRSQLVELITRYNKLLPDDIQIVLADMLSFSEYINIERFTDLAILAGTDNFDHRIEELEKLGDGHYLLGASTLAESTEVKYKRVTACKSMYVFTLDSPLTVERDVPTSLKNATVDLLSRAFGVEFPNFSQENYAAQLPIFSEKLKTSQALESMADCGSGRVSVSQLPGGDRNKGHKGSAEIMENVRKVIEAYDNMDGKKGHATSGERNDAAVRSESRDTDDPDTNRARKSRGIARPTSPGSARTAAQKRPSEHGGMDPSVAAALRDINQRISGLVDSLNRKQGGSPTSQRNVERRVYRRAPPWTTRAD